MVAPLVAAAGISAAGSLLGGLFGGSSAKKAAKYQLQATREQIAAANQNRDYQYSLNAPTISQGQRASDLYAGFLGAGGGDATTDWEAYVRGNPDALADWQKYHTDMNLSDYGQYHYAADGSQRDLTPFQTSAQSAAEASAAALDTFRGSTGYQDLLKTGLAAVNSNAYARGMGDSGATLKALQDRGTSIADSSAQGWLGNLGNLISQGSAARGLVANVGTNTVNASNAANQAGAEGQANAALTSGQNWSNVLQNIGKNATSVYGSSYGGGAGGVYGSYPPYTTPPYAGLRA